MNILVTGGAGYIGSHTIVELLNSGHNVIVVDNLSNSSQESLRRVEKITNKTIPFYKIDLCDKSSLEKVFKENDFDAVIHFAGLKAVGESVEQPLLYYRNNIVSTLTLLEIMNKFDVKKLVFSSSATVYGFPDKLPLTEESLVGIGITNPYGQTKFMIEQILRDLVVTNSSLKITILRYFNPVGAHESGLIGEDPNGIPNNLLPFISQVAIGRFKKVNIFGDDYNTPDGTGVRDYIHVVDLAKGHVAAINHLQRGISTYNLGTGIGISVLELISAFSKVTGKEIAYQITVRRSGDIASCYADPTKAKDKLNWHTELSIKKACEDSWRWQSKNPNGYNQ